MTKPQSEFHVELLPGIYQVKLWYGDHSFRKVNDIQVNGARWTTVRHRVNEAESLE